MRRKIRLSFEWKDCFAKFIFNMDFQIGKQIFSHCWHFNVNTKVVVTIIAALFNSVDPTGRGTWEWPTTRVTI